MSNERGRHQLYEELKNVMSQESADELMGYLPPVGWADVATKSDLGMIRNEMDSLRADLRGEMAGLRGEMGELRGEMGELRGEMGELRGEMGGLRAELRGEVGGLRAEMRGEIGGMHAAMDALGSELRTEMHKAFVTQTRWLVGLIFVAMTFGITVASAVN